jgi:hypothetical protein
MKGAKKKTVVAMNVALSPLFLIILTWTIHKRVSADISWAHPK